MWNEIEIEYVMDTSHSISISFSFNILYINFLKIHNIKKNTIIKIKNIIIKGINIVYKSTW